MKCLVDWLIFRKLFRIQATVLKEDEEAVTVEEKCPAKSLVEVDRGRYGESVESSTSSGFEKFVIKIEQSVNVFLTVN